MSTFNRLPRPQFTSDAAQNSQADASQDTLSSDVSFASLGQPFNFHFLTRPVFDVTQGNAVGDAPYRDGERTPSLQHSCASPSGPIAMKLSQKHLLDMPYPH